jgi:hypothetical protein
LARIQAQNFPHRFDARNIRQAFVDEGRHTVDHFLLGRTQRVGFIEFLDRGGRKSDTANLREHGRDFHWPAFANFEMGQELLD